MCPFFVNAKLSDKMEDLLGNHINDPLEMMGTGIYSLMEN